MTLPSLQLPKVASTLGGAFICTIQTRRTEGWTRIRDEIRRRKRMGYKVEGSAVFVGKSELARSIVAVFFFTAPVPLTM
jgi:hypothetical protein